MGGSLDSNERPTHLELSELSKKGDFNTCLIDCFMYDDLSLRAAAFQLLHATFSQRTSLLSSLKRCTILENSSLGVYGTVHILRSSINDLKSLTSEYNRWGVHSIISGRFDTEKFGKVMYHIETMLRFIYCDDGDHTKKKHKNRKGKGMSRGALDIDQAPSLTRRSSFSMASASEQAAVIHEAFIVAGVSPTDFFLRMDLDHNNSIDLEEFIHGAREILHIPRRDPFRRRA